MRSQHRKQREWRRSLEDKYQEREKGVTPASVHPSEFQPLTNLQKGKGVTFGKISRVGIFVKRTGKYYAALWLWVRFPCGDRDRGRCAAGV